MEGGRKGGREGGEGGTEGGKSTGIQWIVVTPYSVGFHTMFVS